MLGQMVHDLREILRVVQDRASLPSLCCWLLVSFTFFSFSSHTAAGVKNTL